jgi:cobalt-zinc-cadmium efflux system protein
VSGGHHHHHDHGHAHGHGHHHAPADYGRAFAIGIVLNLGFVVVEAAYGLIAGSMALLADAGHNLSDVLGLAIAWGAHILARRRPTPRFTYGLRGSTILAALFNGLLLMVACGAIALEAARRFADPQPVAGATVMIVAGIGIAVNLGTALLFLRGQSDDINIRGAFLHMAADAGVSAGVVVAGLLTLQTGADWIDPATSLLIVGVILWSTWGLLKEAIVMAMQAVPTGIDPAAVADALGELAGVARVHHVHIWATSTTETAMTVHLVMPGGPPGDGFLAEAAAMLKHRFGIGHATIQIETGGCADAECA